MAHTPGRGGRGPQTRALPVTKLRAFEPPSGATMTPTRLPASLARCLLSIALAATGSAASAAGTPAPAPKPSDTDLIHALAAIDTWQMVEGVGLSSGWVTLGMTYADLQLRAPLSSYYGCWWSVNTGATCEVDPRGGPRVFAILTGFDPTSTVRSIQFNDNGAAVQWSTTAGAHSGQAIAFVRRLYPGSVISRWDYSDWSFEQHDKSVVARREGYAYQRSTFCNKDTGDACDTSWYHEIFPAGGQPVGP